MPTTRAHKFCDTQPTTSLALLRIQLTIPPMIPGNASAALIPNQNNRDGKTLSLLLIHSFNLFSSLGGGSPSPDAAAPPPGNNPSTSTLMAIPMAVSMEAIIILCSLNRVQIFSANEVSLSNTLAIVSLKLAIWFFNLPFRRSIDSCLIFKSSLRSLIHLVMSSFIASSYSPGYSQNSSSLQCSLAMHSSNSSFLLPQLLENLSGALWQGSNSKIENYRFLAVVTLFEKVLQPFLAS